MPGPVSATSTRTVSASQAALNVAAIRGALADAGLTTADLDGVLTKAPTSTFPRLWAPQIMEDEDA